MSAVSRRTGVDAWGRAPAAGGGVVLYTWHGKYSQWQCPGCAAPLTTLGTPPGDVRCRACRGDFEKETETMTTTEPQSPLAALYAALAKAQGQMRGASKDKTNPHLRTKYADLASVWEACRDALSANGLAVIQLLIEGPPGAVTVRTVLAHASGGSVESSFTLPVTKQDAHGYGSAITYARRYALAAMVGVAPEDDDGAAAVQAQPPPARRSWSETRDARKPAPEAPRSTPAVTPDGELVEPGPADVSQVDEGAAQIEWATKQRERLHAAAGDERALLAIGKEIKAAKPPKQYGDPLFALYTKLRKECSAPSAEGGAA